MSLTHSSLSPWHSFCGLEIQQTIETASGESKCEDNAGERSCMRHSVAAVNHCFIVAFNALGRGKILSFE